MKRIITLILASVLILGVICSCDGGTNGGGTGTGKDVIKTDGDYKIPDVNMNGETVTVLNVDSLWQMKIDFITPEDADDTLDIAIYESNKRLEEQFNFVFVEDEYPFTEDGTDAHIDMANHFIRNVNSGDDIYDFIHYPVNQYPELITSGYLMDLTELDALQLDKPWWDAQINEVINVNGRQYMACGSINLMPYEAMTTVFFNKDLLADNGLDDPYEMVRNGTWTLEAMTSLAREAQNLNTDAYWGMLEGGTSVYGHAQHEYFPCHFLIGAGVRYVTEENGKLTFSTGNDDFYLAVEEIRELFTGAASGGLAGFRSGNSEYIKYFGADRALFLTSELKAGVEMRDYEVNFGILPTPKLRAEQDKYYTDETERLHFICIPTLSENPDDVAAIIDAMAYDRYKNVIPVYYDSYVTYKGLRDEDSLEMLEIMSEGRTMDIGFAYGWCTKFVMRNINTAIRNGEDISSLLAANAQSINETIDEFASEYFN